MRKRIARKPESQGLSFLRKDEGFARSDGNLSNENPESEFFQYGSSVIMVAHTRAATQEQ
jgi:hypothetical protein